MLPRTMTQDLDDLKINFWLDKSQENSFTEDYMSYTHILRRLLEADKTLLCPWWAMWPKYDSAD